MSNESLVTDLEGTPLTLKNNDSSSILMEGWLGRRTTYLKSKSVWNDRYFILQNDKTMSYHLHRGDLKPKGIYQLNRSCIIGDVEIWNKKSKSSHVNNEREMDGSMGGSDGLSSPSTTGASTVRSRMFKKSSKEGGGPRYCIKVTWLETAVAAVDGAGGQDVVSSSAAGSVDGNGSPPNSPGVRKRNDDGVRSLFHSKATAAPLSPQLSQRSLPTEEGDTLKQPFIRKKRRNSAHTTVTFRHEELEEKEEDGVIRHYEHQMEQQALQSQYQEDMMLAMQVAAKKAGKRKTYKMIMQGTGVATAAGVCLTATVLSFGVGLVPTLMFGGMSAIAGGSGAMAGRNYVKNTPKNTTLVFSCHTLDEARKWKVMLEECCNANEAKVSVPTLLHTVQDKLNHQTTIIPNPSLIVPSLEIGSPERPDSPSTLRRQSYSLQLQTKWKPMEVGWAVLLALGGTHGLRIFQEEKETPNTNNHLFSRQLSIVGGLCPVVKAHQVLHATPLNAFMCLMTHARTSSLTQQTSISPRSEQRASFRVIETMNDHMDVLHLVCRPLYLFPSWTAPRDFCLFRYWRFDDDGSYIICYDSVQHRECPPKEGFVRGEMHGVISIAPSRAHDKQHYHTETTNVHHQECLLNYIVQVNPKGWVPTFFSYQGYIETFAVNTLLQLLDVRDALDHDRFLTVSLDDIHPKVQEAVKLFPLTGCSNGAHPPHHNQNKSNDDDHTTNHLLNYDFSYSDLEKSPMKTTRGYRRGSKWTAQTLSSVLDPLHQYMWAEPDANSFMVRGKHYKKDNVKINAGESAFRLITVDMVQVNSPILTGMASHPKERLQQSLSAPDTPPFMFIINIILPGPPNYHFVMYYAVDDISLIDGTDGTPFSKLANKFFFGNSDEFRDKTFKLIPCVVEGNFIVRKACGSTPAIMGTKLKQHYFRGDRYFELLLDVGSSAVAAGVVRLSVGYARTLIVDMAFLLEGDDETTLPEKVMGTSRLNYVDFTKGVRSCEPVEEF